MSIEEGQGADISAEVEPRLVYAYADELRSLRTVAEAAERASVFLSHLAEYEDKGWSCVACSGHEPLEIEAAFLRTAVRLVSK